MSLYDVLGAGPDDSADDLRRAYRRRAWALHPDRNAGGSPDPEAGQAMRDLNRAWAVLSDPEARRRYDDRRVADARTGDRWVADARTGDRWVADARTGDRWVADARTGDRWVADARTGDRWVADAPGEAATSDPDAGREATFYGAGRRLRWLRPSVALVAVMGLIFVVTAYAGPRTNDRTGPTSATTAPPAPPAGVGQCVLLQPGAGAVVACVEPNSGRVEAVVGPGEPCPVGSTAAERADRWRLCLIRPG